MIAEANQWPRRGRRRSSGTDEEPRVPHGVRLPGDAAHLLLAALAVGGRARARALRDDGRARRGRRGASSCATTTSSRSRWSARSTGRRCTAGTPTTRGCASNVGIRRRLAPLLDNSRAELELAHALLFSLPGSPVPVLRRRDRHGRQHLAARPRRLPHADAVDARPQRRLLDRRPRQALPAGRAVARLQLHARQRRVAARAVPLAAALGAQRHPRAQGASRPSGSARCGCSRPTTSRCSPSCASTRAPATQFGDAPERILCVFSLRAQPGRGADRRSTASPERRLYDLFGGGDFPSVDEDGTLTLTLGTQSFYWLHLGETRVPSAHARSRRVSGRLTLSGMSDLDRSSRRLRPRDDGSRRRHRAASCPRASPCSTPTATSSSAGTGSPIPGIEIPDARERRARHHDRARSRRGSAGVARRRRDRADAAHPVRHSASRSSSTTRRTTCRCSTASAAGTTSSRSTSRTRHRPARASTRPSTATARASARSRSRPSSTASTSTTPTTPEPTRSPPDASPRRSLGRIPTELGVDARRPAPSPGRSGTPSRPRGSRTTCVAPRATRTTSRRRRGRSDLPDNPRATATPSRSRRCRRARADTCRCSTSRKPIALQLAPPPSTRSQPALATPPTGFGPAGYRQQTGPVFPEPVLSLAPLRADPDDVVPDAAAADDEPVDEIPASADSADRARQPEQPDTEPPRGPCCASRPRSSSTARAAICWCASAAARSSCRPGGKIEDGEAAHRGPRPRAGRGARIRARPRRDRVSRLLPCRPRPTRPTPSCTPRCSP